MRFVDDVEENELQAAKDWLAQRYRADSKWFDIDPAEEIPACVTPESRTVLHMFQIAFAPEIRKRLEDGRLDGGFVLTRAQLVQWGDRPKRDSIERRGSR